MAAIDNVNHEQFRMPVSALLDTKSIDYGHEPVRAHMDDIRADVGRTSHDDLKASLTKNGQQAPVVMYNNHIHGGHHRIVAAHDLGWSHLNVSHGGME